VLYHFYGTTKNDTLNSYAHWGSNALTFFWALSGRCIVVVAAVVVVVIVVAVVVAAVVVVVVVVA